jgi:hypothetical protein
MSDPGVPVAGGSMKRSTVAYDRLQALAQADARVPPPYDFAEFTRRREARAEMAFGRSTRLGRVTAIAASLSVVLIGAALWRQSGQTPPASMPRVPIVSPEAQAATEEFPALVSAGQLTARDALEEHIALIDALLSESRIEGAQDDMLRAMEQGRSTLVDSLQRVSYAHQLIGP